MQAITAALQNAATEIGADESQVRETLEGPAADLQLAAAEFAKVAINTFRGELQNRAIDVSKAIAEFTLELSDPTPDSRSCQD